MAHLRETPKDNTDQNLVHSLIWFLGTMPHGSCIWNVKSQNRSQLAKDKPEYAGAQG